CNHAVPFGVTYGRCGRHAEKRVTLTGIAHRATPTGEGHRIPLSSTIWGRFAEVRVTASRERRHTGPPVTLTGSPDHPVRVTGASRRSPGATPSGPSTLAWCWGRTVHSFERLSAADAE